MALRSSVLLSVKDFDFDFDFGPDENPVTSAPELPDKTFTKNIHNFLASQKISRNLTSAN